MSAIQKIDFHVDILAALLWRHDMAPNLRGILDAKQKWYDENEEAFWNDWIRDVFDLRTANPFGLKVWSIILGLPLVIVTPPTPTTKANFGFGIFNKNFNNGNFGQLGSSSTNLTPEQARLLLRLRYYQLISRCTVPEINRFMAMIFKDYGSVYVLDDNKMHTTYVFKFALPPLVETLLKNFDVLPRAAGVKVSYIVSTDPVFGFGQFNKNFNNGSFA